MKYLRLILIVLFATMPNVSFGQVVIQMEEDSGVYKVPCKVNGLKLKFIFDTGASTVSISSAVANMMLENGYLSSSDVIGKGLSQIADGGLVDHTKIILRKIEIGGLFLRNVEAVVMPQQSAPLLLGQSAIRKLGKVSISGNRLTISSYSAANPYMSEQLHYSEADYEDMSRAAGQYVREGNFIMAAEKYDILYKAREMYIKDIMAYAVCLHEVNRHEDALGALLYYEEDVKNLGLIDMGVYYLQICIEAYWAGEYNFTIKYGRICQSASAFPLETYADATYWISAAYDKLNDKIQARTCLISFIARYLQFMEISATDCWTKDYQDLFLAGQYYDLALKFDNYSEGKKYFIIAAAWGNKNAIEVCRDFEWSYSKKPYEYAY